MSASCPDPASLAAYADRQLPESEHPALEAHLAGCPDCLAELRLLLDLARPETRIRPLHWGLAAASLLAAVTTLLWRGPERPPAPPSRPAPPDGTVLTAEERPRGWVLADGTRISLSAGSAARGASAGTLELHRGGLWLDAASDLNVRLPEGGELTASDAELGIFLSGTPAPASTLSAFWLSAATAAEPSRLELTCRRGSCRLRWRGVVHVVAAGERLLDVPGEMPSLKRLDPATLDAALAWSWTGPEAIPSLQALAAGTRTLTAEIQGTLIHLRPKDTFGILTLGDLPGGDYRLSIQVRPRKAGGDIGLAFPATSRCPYWMLGTRGAPLLPGTWTELAVERRGDRIHLWRDGIRVSTIPTRHADRMTPGTELPALGLWGSEIELREVRWRVWRQESAQ